MVANFQPTTEGVAQVQVEKPIIYDMLALKIGYLYSAVWINNWPNLSIWDRKKGVVFNRKCPISLMFLPSFLSLCMCYRASWIRWVEDIYSYTATAAAAVLYIADGIIRLLSNWQVGTIVQC